MSWHDDENARRAARLDRAREWDEHFRATGAPGPDPRGTPFAEQSGRDEPCNCGAHEDEPGGSSGYPESLADTEGQPGRVLLGLMLPQRNADPLTAYEEARAMRAADLACRMPRLDGREALRKLSVSREGNGATLAGSHALALIRQLGIAGVGHEPGVSP